MVITLNQPSYFLWCQLDYETKLSNSLLIEYIVEIYFNNELPKRMQRGIN